MSDTRTLIPTGTYLATGMGDPTSIERRVTLVVLDETTPWPERDLRQWQAMDGIEAADASGALPADACVLIWNPCDGHHLYRLSEYSAASIAADAREGFGTAWCLMPLGPEQAPADWRAMSTLEEAWYNDEVPRMSSVLLWSPTGAHKLPWLLVDQPHVIADQGRQGLFTGWRVPPASPVE